LNATVGICDANHCLTNSELQCIESCVPFGNPLRTKNNVRNCQVTCRKLFLLRTTISSADLSVVTYLILLTFPRLLSIRHPRFVPPQSGQLLGHSLRLFVHERMAYRCFILAGSFRTQKDLGEHSSPSYAVVVGERMGHHRKAIFRIPPHP
jgi:hypothetical protein